MMWINIVTRNSRWPGASLVSSVWKQWRVACKRSATPGQPLTIDHTTHSSLTKVRFPSQHLLDGACERSHLLPAASAVLFSSPFDVVAVLHSVHVSVAVAEKLVLLRHLPDEINEMHVTQRRHHASYGKITFFSFVSVSLQMLQCRGFANYIKKSLSIICITII